MLTTKIVWSIHNYIIYTRSNRNIKSTQKYQTKSHVQFQQSNNPVPLWTIHHASESDTRFPNMGGKKELCNEV